MRAFAIDQDIRSIFSLARCALMFKNMGVPVQGNRQMSDFETLENAQDDVSSYTISGPVRFMRVFRLNVEIKSLGGTFGQGV